MMGAVVALLVGFFAYIIMRMTAVPMAPLYSELTLDDSASVVRELDAAGVAYELKFDGAQVLVPKDQVTRLRMQLAQKGVPTGGSIGYEIFDKQSTLGTTSFVQNINHIRALEGELARSIRTIGRVQAARVHLVIPERQLFQRDRREPTASIMLKVSGTLDNATIRAIQHLAASAVDGLKPSRVSIVDETGRLLASGADADDQAFLASSLQEKSQGHEARLKQQVEDILNSVVGPGRARVQISAELDFNRVTQTSDTFNPDGQVVRSTQTKEENSTSANGERQVTVANQVPGNQAGDQANGDAQRDASSATEEVVNYEISKTTRTEITEAGRVKRLSVAVVVDGLYAQDANGQVTYTPRPPEELERIAALVRSAVGFDQARGDQVEVVNLRFAEGPDKLPLEAEPGLFEFSRDDMMRFIELGILVLVSLLMLLFAVRPLMKRIFKEPEPPALAGPAGAQGGLAGALAAAEGNLLTADGKPIDPSDPNAKLLAADAADKLDAARAMGALHASSVAKVGEMIKKTPLPAAMIVRGWLNEAA